jgi:hypothetical protein
VSPGDSSIRQATLAAVEGATQMYYWAGIENGPAIGSGTGIGFRITSSTEAESGQVTAAGVPAGDRL